MEQAQFLEVEKAAPARRHFPLDSGIEAAVFATEPAERPNERHIADHIHHFAIDRRRTLGELVMERPTRGGKAEHRYD